MPVIDFLFPADPQSNPPETSLIVCASWAQADNISTDKHKAVTCYNAAMWRPGMMRNAHMAAGAKQSALERKWGNKRLLVIEEVGMIPNEQYNMLLYRSFFGRYKRQEVQENEYDKPKGAMGRMPITIKLGDFLQKRPTANRSMLDDPAESTNDVPPEH